MQRLIRRLTFTTAVRADLGHRAFLDHVAFLTATATLHRSGIGAVLGKVAFLLADTAGDTSSVAVLGAVALHMAVRPARSVILVAGLPQG